MEYLIRRSIWFVVFLLAQILLLSKIHLFHYATPFLFIYFIMQFPKSYSRIGLLLWGFFMGLFVDISNNTPGVTACALTIVAFVQPYLLEYFAPNDTYDIELPSIRTMTTQRFFRYAIAMTGLFCVLFFTFEVFNLYNFVDWLLRVILSTALTIIFILVLEKFRR